MYDGGIAQLNDELEIMPETRLGDYNAGEVYSAAVIGEYIYFGLSDYVAPDEVTVVNANGDEINRYVVGALPGDFAVWESCATNGDVNFDSVLNVLDVVMIVGYVLGNDELTDTQVQASDLNGDGIVNVLDIVMLVDAILNY